MLLIDHPKSAWSGTISAPGAARNPAAASRAMKATATTHQAGWMRRCLRCAGGVVDIDPSNFLQKSYTGDSISRLRWRKVAEMALRSDWSQEFCPVKRSLDVLGDPWVLLIVRDVLHGRGRFDQLRENLGISEAVLSRRAEVRKFTL